MKYEFKLENLNCANCASKIEKKIANTPQYENVSFNFANKKLVLESDKDNVKAEIQNICDSIEDDVCVLDRNDNTKNSKSSEKKELVFIGISVLLLLVSFCFEVFSLDSSFFGKLVVFGMCFCATVFSGYKTFIKGFKSVLKLKIDETTLMSVAVIAAFCLSQFVEGAMVTVLFAIGEILQDKAVNSSRKDIEKLANIRPDNATVIENEKPKTVAAELVKVGSTILVKPHEIIPIDGVITEGNTTLDTSALTGESIPVDACKNSAVMSGSVNGNGLIKIKTTKEFGESSASKIIKLVEDAAAQKGTKEKLITRFASVYTPIVMAIALLLAVVPPLLGLGSFSLWIYRALVCLVASCPCAIVISVPLSYYAGIGAASKNGVLIKGGKYIEALAKADSFVFDKTGTLTSGKLKVNKVVSFSNYSENEILSFASSCEKYSSHPIAKAIKEESKSKSTKELTLTDYSEKAGNGVSAKFLEKELLCCSEKSLSKEQKELCAENKYSVFVLLDKELIGAISVSDTVREETKSVISQLKKLNIKRTVMLTGDNINSAKEVCEKTGITEYKASLLPNEKLQQIQEIKENSKAVCFVGDGINDAPVLSASDCGIAMGFGSDLAIEASDAVLSSGNLKMLPKAIKISRKTMRTATTNIVFALSIKALVIILAALGIATMWMSVLADTGISVICVLYAARLLKLKNK